ncbi:MAG TPA: ATP-dependent Clp protease adaptor ClpS [Persephonella sp.]|uniref:ATP-dependent Clp protease adaptor protein ClpS n=1 Tax=Persephonella marina (strain DSM 14350 / EX-H1) TaxID=123214 RepID=C0QRD5_PERMH|nr:MULTISPECIES: ATP-dependent Clp protease adaptor ClpS [Persephonella]ACO04103.1 ATP-dependent Clp protease adaptor protein ClpS [Persephonella marina EX-H1]HCB68977.1 ATP-dependent Clp protease adaptor ClpS [Persephonella sp.]
MGIGFEVEVEKDVQTYIPAKVVVYNDDWHTFEEVIYQIMKAIKCDLETAQNLTWEIHTKGKAVVYEGDFEEALKVANILEEIDLSVEIIL